MTLTCEIVIVAACEFKLDGDPILELLWPDSGLYGDDPWNDTKHLK